MAIFCTVRPQLGSSKYRFYKYQNGSNCRKLFFWERYASNFCNILTSLKTVFGLPIGNKKPSCR